MYRTTKKTQLRKDEKRQLILDTAARVFSAKGYRNATVKDIVSEAAVSVGSFYFYFAGKEELFLELYKNIVKQFGAVTESVLDIDNYTTLKNFTRVMTATLWMYGRKREIARIILLESVVADPVFQKLEAERTEKFALEMAEWFKRFKLHNRVYIPDERVAAFMYVGSYYSLINDWLSSGQDVPLTQYAYGFCVYNLQALGIPYGEAEVKEYIAEVLEELPLKAKI